MPMLDLIVMRLATAELLTQDTPTGVVLSEAVELASRYSTDESGRFVNGVLAAIANDVRP
jgi:N utilization substance protein B